MSTCYRAGMASLLATILSAAPSFAFETPLSDQAIREAYFLGQRGNDSLSRLLAKYTKTLPPSRSGPHIASITVLTPFALVAQMSGQHSGGYSAQQARLDHLGKAETVRIMVQIQFTDTYGALIPAPTGSRCGSPSGFVPRPYDFWRDFDVRVFSPTPRDGDRSGLRPTPEPSAQDTSTSGETGQQEQPAAQMGPLRPYSSHGEPNLLCNENGACELTGATLYFDFLASVFDASSALVEVVRPEGDPVSVELDLTSLR
jgi:hypothetical protein